MTKRWEFVIFAMVALITVASHSAFAAGDWDEDDDSAKGALGKPQATHAMSYPGAADEQPLRVQSTLPSSGRYPDSTAHPEKAKAVDDDGNPLDD